MPLLAELFLGNQIRKERLSICCQHNTVVLFGHLLFAYLTGQIARAAIFSTRISESNNETGATAGKLYGALTGAAFAHYVYKNLKHS